MTRCNLRLVQHLILVWVFFIQRNFYSHAFSTIHSSSAVKSRIQLTSNDLDSADIDVSKPTLQNRKISSVQKYARLPVWPVLNGVILFLLSKLLPNSTVAKLEDSFGGRVCPNFFEGMSTSPFIMLVHHKHSFASFDPIRYFQKQLILPEGFPAHPHRGFITLTYCINGGMIHRDSLGIKQTYGAESRHKGNVAQWLVAGAGLLHEEMWDIDHDKDGIFSNQELFQLWVNLPMGSKMESPRLSLLNVEEKQSAEEGVVSIPTVETKDAKTIVLVGQYKDALSDVETFSPMSILHVQMNANSSWRMKLPPSYDTGIIYMRTGSAFLPSESSNDKYEIESHYTANLSPYGENLDVEAGTDGADFMLLVGQNLREPFQAQGSMVMNTAEEINVAYNDYSLGKMGIPWDHKNSDTEWRDHIKNSPSIYRQK